MLSKENIGKEIADDQMDYEISPAELTTGATEGHEDELSNDSELMVTANDVSLIGDEIAERATFFVKTFVKEFEEKISEYSKEAKPGSNIQKSGKTSTAINSIVNHVIPPSPLKLAFNTGNKLLGHFSAKKHRKKAKTISATIEPYCKDETRKILVEAGLDIFQKFEKQFIEIVDVNHFSWQMGIQKLAIDTVSRVMNCILTNSEGREFSVDLITRGVVLDKSKEKHLFATYSGYQVKDKRDSKILMTSELYKNVGIKKAEGQTVTYYQYDSEECSCVEIYGYRLPFAWELEEWEEVKQKYVLSETPEKRYVYILDEEKKEKLASSILKEIDGEDLVQKKDIEGVKEHLRKQDENMCQFSFNFSKMPEVFIERKEVLKELIRRLNSKSQELKMSRVVLISGDPGVGKSELARSCGFSQRHLGAWVKIMWIDASSYTNLSNSFHELAEELRIFAESGQRRDREIESIVEDIYKHLQDTKSFFVFDNASNYAEIKKFLPANFSLFLNRERPFVLITSSNKNWKKEIEDIEEIKLDNFRLRESEEFTHKALGKDESQGEDKSHNNSISKLAKGLNYSPLALKTTTSYIKQKGLSVREYLDLLVAQSISRELFTTLQVNFDQIRGEKNIEQQSHDILAFMAYLSPDQIDTTEIFLQKKSEKDKLQVLGALNLLNKFSVIELEKGIAKIHQEVQKTIRLEQRKEGREEEVLRKIMILLMNNNCKNVSHIVSIWNYASEYNKLVNEFIESDYGGSTILHLLAKDGNEEIIKLILEKTDLNKLSKIINAVDEEGFTSLGYAVMHGHLGVIEYLIEKGAILNLHNKDGISFLHAFVHGSLGVVECPVGKEDNVNLQDKKGMCFLHFAAIYGRLDIVKYLVKKGASVDLQDKKGMSPLHFAVIYGHLDIVKYLVKKGASVDLQDQYGISPLHFAAIHGHLDIACYLVINKANIDLKSKEGESPLYFAVMHGCLYSEDRTVIVNNHLDIIKCFLDEGANASLECKNFLYRYAITNNDQSIIYYLMKAQLIVNPFKRKSGTICTQVLMEERPRTLGLQNYALSDSEKYQYVLSKKRKLENMSTASEENALNIQLLQGSQYNINLPSGISMQFAGPFDRMESMVSVTNRIPMSSFNSVAVEPVNNKNSKGSNFTVSY